MTLPETTQAWLDRALLTHDVETMLTFARWALAGYDAGHWVRPPPGPAASVRRYTKFPGTRLKNCAKETAALHDVIAHLSACVFDYLSAVEAALDQKDTERALRTLVEYLRVNSRTERTNAV